MIALCNPVAKKPYMNLRLNNTVTDTGTGGNTPSNSGVTFTTDQFGRANMAGDWNVDTDYLELSESVADEIRGLINSNSCSVLMNIYLTDSDWSTGRIFSQWGNSGNRSFRLSYTALPSFNEFSATLSTDGVNNSNNVNSDVVARGQWYNIVVNYNIKQRIYKDGVLINEATPDDYSTIYNSSSTFRIGTDASSSRNSFRGNINNFRIYNIALTDGQLKILNNQKGRIIA